MSLRRCKCLLLSLIGVSAAGPFYVSLAGNDSWTGQLPLPTPSRDNGPFLTPARAAAALAALSRPLLTDTYVFLRGGVYQLEETLTLGVGQSGSGQHASVHWSTYPGDEAAVLSGSLGIADADWEPGTGGAWVAPLPPAAPNRSRALRIQGFDRRWPARVPSVTGPGLDGLYNDDATLHWASSLTGCGTTECWPLNCSDPINQWGFVYNASDARGPSPSWIDIPGIDALVFGSWTASWAPVRAVVGTNATLLVGAPLHTSAPGHWGGIGCPSGARYVLSNVAEALAPGNFYVNDSARTISYMPFPTEDPKSLRASVPAMAVIVEVGSGAQFIILENLSIFGASDGGLLVSSYTDPLGAVLVTGAADITLRNLTVSGTDGSGICLGGVSRVSVDHCHVTDAGGDGIGNSGVWTNVTVSNSTTNSTGFLFLDQPSGIRTSGAVDGVVTVTHNLVLDSAHNGIAVTGLGVTAPPPGTPSRFIVTFNRVSRPGHAILSDFGGIGGGPSQGVSGCQGTDSCYLHALIASNFVSGTRAYNYGGEGICDCGAWWWQLGWAAVHL